MYSSEQFLPFSRLTQNIESVLPVGPNQHYFQQQWSSDKQRQIQFEQPLSLNFLAVPYSLSRQKQWQISQTYQQLNKTLPSGVMPLMTLSQEKQQQQQQQLTQQQQQQQQQQDQQKNSRFDILNSNVNQLLQDRQLTPVQQGTDQTSQNRIYPQVNQQSQ